MARARTADSWFSPLIVESKVKKSVRQYLSKAIEAPTCRCERPVRHIDLDGFYVCIYCGR